jgi:hypothetical protein
VPFRCGLSIGYVCQVERGEIADLTTGRAAVTVDATYDFRREIRSGRDPDSESVTLKRYHQLLWSKLTPSGMHIELADRSDGFFLYPGYTSVINGCEVRWSSDAVTNAWMHWRRESMVAIVGQATERLREEYNACAYTVGAYMMWPRDQVRPHAGSINQDRGTSWEIYDRIDLTLECVRL